MRPGSTHYISLKGFLHPLFNFTHLGYIRGDDGPYPSEAGPHANTEGSHLQRVHLRIEQNEIIVNDYCDTRY